MQAFLRLKEMVNEDTRTIDSPPIRVKEENNSDSESRSDSNNRMEIETTIPIENITIEINPLKVEVKEEPNDEYSNYFNYEPGVSYNQPEDTATSQPTRNESYEYMPWSASLPTFNSHTYQPPAEKPERKIKRRRRQAKKVFTCQFCQKMIYTQSKFNNHVVIHTKRLRNFKCDECHKGFFTAHLLKLHKDTHKIEPQVCPVCKKIYQNKSRLKSHMMTHTEIKFECDHCQHSFNAKSKLAAHMVVHTNKLPYLCKFCGKGFKHKSSLNNHENVHKNKKPYTCTECGRKFTMWSNCDKHMKRKHGCTLAKTVRTPLGRMPINQRTGEQIELVNEHGFAEYVIPKKTEFKCDGCGKKFKTKLIMQDHKKIAHHEFEAQVCPICHATLANWQGLKVHLMIHSDKTFECDHCHLTFNTKSKLRCHMLVHIDVYPFVCTYCDKRFKRRNHLTLHLRRHE